MLIFYNLIIEMINHPFSPPSLDCSAANSLKGGSNLLISLPDSGKRITETLKLQSIYPATSYPPSKRFGRNKGKVMS